MPAGFVPYVPKYVKNAEMNAQSIIWIIARNVRGSVKPALRNAGKWRHNRINQFWIDAIVLRIAEAHE